MSPIPGANSVIAALSGAGLATENFHFYGFLSARASRRETQLRELQDIDGTLVLFESSHRIKSLLQQVQQCFSRRQCVVAKELTKLHERFLYGDAAHLLTQFEQDPALTKGEFVVLIDNASSADSPRAAADETAMLRILLDEVSVKVAARIAARLTGKKKNEMNQLAARVARRRRSLIITPFQAAR